MARTDLLDAPGTAMAQQIAHVALALLLLGVCDLLGHQIVIGGALHLTENPDWRWAMRAMR